MSIYISESGLKSGNIKFAQHEYLFKYHK